MLAGSRLFKEEVLTGKNYKASDQASFPSKIVFLCYGGFISIVFYFRVLSGCCIMCRKIAGVNFGSRMMIWQNI